MDEPPWRGSSLKEKGLRENWNGVSAVRGNGYLREWLLVQDEDRGEVSQLRSFGGAALASG